MYSLSSHSTHLGFLSKIFKHVDYVTLSVALSLSLLGLVTMNSFSETNAYFEHQIIWIVTSVLMYIIASRIDFRFLRRTNVVMFLFIMIVLSLIAVLLFGETVKGAQSRFNLGFFAVQPSEYAKIIIIVLLAKYFARRHIEIANIRHILISGFYAFVIFVLILVQPDFGSAVMIAFIWLGMVLVSGLSKKHILLVFLIAFLSGLLMWSFVFQDYQKDRIMTFIHPLADIRGVGYNAYQSTIAVGSGQVLGKGIGYGTQSKLRFLPEYQTDFIFASYAEEWGFVGVFILFVLFLILIWRILIVSQFGVTNFEVLFGVGIATLFISHFIVNVGSNIGILPVTGVTLPFVSYGGSHLLGEFFALGMLASMKRHARTVRKEDSQKEFTII